ncbi:50S ribosomal protein L21 [Candidatus Daviesbacteria bacterium RIFCSPLOWO2_01_FULL_43_38]|uniref:Large ribosomal subunit protein bL21 n=2 Tax=Candidatus Daviesiibacteriota TaxID=1752718 RepID=A0A1F5K0Q1_9BACT|nr:MAG: 50S ribosomal protein L21 [Candidatus Daviesbacteria bacterium GW2011_GWA2_42_7]OGE34261.1 MAG: 50S ribosomal protein L21 [Candidatus Daviesbacteria bacterium RIFCSPHIGHO2_12_FULL_43_11]OGE63770.1 MAG: 50S ribosomal protein L21 [Candidatus Daviesbacteria bacterium RIFCSPLOWO2_01_FULL_43_38]OGE69279.1 MAG: 50S ribosomal protein L21 [Candidatus Daviesbacteria bacterium RIFCSPLOWO2_02_FULL_43_11]
MNYVVFEISGRQYLVKPGQRIEVDKINGGEKTLSIEKVLLLKDEKGVEVGTPYLKESLKLEVLETIKKDKVRVAKFHAKANYRKVSGQRREVTIVKWATEKQVEPKVKKEAVKPVKKSVKKAS